MNCVRVDKYLCLCSTINIRARVLKLCCHKLPPLLVCVLHISGSTKSAPSQCAHKEHAPNDFGKFPVQRRRECNLKTAEYQFVASSEVDCRDAVYVGILRNSTIMPSAPTRECQLNGAHFSHAPSPKICLNCVGLSLYSLWSCTEGVLVKDSL